MKVTVVVINHNYSAWVTKALDSIFNDPYKNKQVVLVDDGSQDTSVAVICNYLGLTDEQRETAFKQPQIAIKNGVEFKFLRYEKAGGPSRARNTAIKIGWADTDIFAVLDSDDEFRNGKITKSIQAFALDDHIGAVYTDYDTLAMDTGVLRRECKEAFDFDRLMQECIVHSACMIRKKVLEDIGLYDETMRCCEDYDEWIRIGEKYLLYHIPESLMIVRTHSHNSTNSVPKEVWQRNWQRIAEKVKQRHGQT